MVALATNMIPRADIVADMSTMYLLEWSPRLHPPSCSVESMPSCSLCR